MLVPEAGSTPLAAADLDRLARAHVEYLPTSVVAFLGPRYCRSLYRYLTTSPSENLFIERRDGAVAGACTLSFSAATLTRRLLFHTPLLFHVPRAVWARETRSRPAIALATGPVPMRRYATVPEVVWLFTAATYRQSGVASRLLERVEEALMQRGETRYAVVTGSADPASTSFYERSGFIEDGTVARWGGTLRLLVKGLG